MTGQKNLVGVRICKINEGRCINLADKNATAGLEPATSLPI